MSGRVKDCGIQRPRPCDSRKEEAKGWERERERERDMGGRRNRVVSINSARDSTIIDQLRIRSEAERARARMTSSHFYPAARRHPLVFHIPLPCRRLPIVPDKPQNRLVRGYVNCVHGKSGLWTGREAFTGKGRRASGRPCGNCSPSFSDLPSSSITLSPSPHVELALGPRLTGRQDDGASCIAREALRLSANYGKKGSTSSARGWTAAIRFDLR